MSNIIYILVMAAVTYAVRVLPLTLIRKPIKNTFLKSFLYYVPYVTLAVMTFPAIIEATSSPISGIIAFVFGVIVAFFGGNIFTTAGGCCVSVFVAELILPLI